MLSTDGLILKAKSTTYEQGQLSERNTFLAAIVVAVIIVVAFLSEKASVTTLCSVLAVIVSAMAFQHNRRIAQEPWLVTYRELHREFWNDAGMARVRAWLCCDEAFGIELLPVLKKRISGEVSIAEYGTLEVLDRFCALMVRAVFMQNTAVSKEQKNMFQRMGYRWWLDRLLARHEIKVYVENNWENLYPQIVHRDSEKRRVREK